MTPEYQAAVASWLAKARSDLTAAEILIQGDRPCLDAGVYHCQQAAEKALKGWLTSRQIEFGKTHDLVALLNQCINLHTPFREFRESARVLSPFAFRFRYPGDVSEPTMEDASDALHRAATFVNFVVAELN